MFDVLARLEAERRPFAVVTVVATKGSTPRKAGAKMAVRADGTTVGTVGGGRFELEVIEEARAALSEGRPRLVRRSLGVDLAMCCGGEMEAFIDVVGVREELVLVGAGHVNAALARVGALLGFDVTIVDDLEEAATPARFPDAARRVHSWRPDEWGSRLDRTTYVVIATRDHAVDQEVLERLGRLGADPAYVGVISSRAKITRFRRRLEARGTDPLWIERVRGPIGVPIRAETPEEIAVAVGAELVAIRRHVDTGAEPGT